VGTATGDQVTVVVDDASDSLGRSVADALRRRRRPVHHVPAERLGLLRVHVEGARASIDGRQLGGVLFRASPWARFGSGFDTDDASFAQAEVTATWLAITRLPTVIAVNRLHPEASVTFSEWPVWRRCLADVGVAQVELAVGDADRGGATWLPWGGGMASAPGPVARRSFATALTSAVGLRRSVWLDGERLAGTGSPPAERAAAHLADIGLRFVGILTDSSGRVATATAYPRVPDDAVPKVAERLGGLLES
jgi:hypothetical protein